MVDNTRVNELQEKLLQAMDILNAKAIESLPYDKTILCTIEDDSTKNLGYYLVSSDSNIFQAYSTASYSKDERVYVTVPQGNFENQKMIVGKKADLNGQPLTYVAPFDEYFDMTNNIILENNNGGLVANAIGENRDFITLYDADCEYCNYNRLGFKANFKSWVKDAVIGEYGIKIILTVTSNDLASKEATESVERVLTFNNTDMYGNSYSFETAYEQQIVFPLDEIKENTITHITINFYQLPNFYDRFGNPIPYTENGYLKNPDGSYQINEENNYVVNKDDKVLEPNLFIEDMYLSFGYDNQVFTKDLVEIYTKDPNTYKRSTSTEKDGVLTNKKNIQLRWIHIQNGKPVNMNSISDKDTDVYSINWYRYRVGAPAADVYSGVYWEKANLSDEEQIWIQAALESLQSQYENGKITDEADYIKRKQEIENNCEISKQFEYYFEPNVNKQQEKIKVIILCNNIPYYSNELIFENEEDLPPSQEAQHIMNALNIVCDDGTNGNYMIYGQDDNIKDTTYGKEIRTLTADFDVDSDGIAESRIDPPKNLVWIFPSNNTMISLLNTNKIEIKDDEENIIGYSLSDETPQYTISSYYSPYKANNTIVCQYSLNGVVYTSEKEFTFGPSGTMGTDQTLVIDFVGDKKAINAVVDETCQLQVQLYDKQNKPVSDLEGIKWSWFYRSDEKIQIAEGEDTNRVINLKFEDNKPNIDGLYIIQVNIGNLETYFPLPISNGYSYIKGPTQVIYQSNGEPSYSREKYELYDNITNAKVDWSIISLEEHVYEFAVRFTKESQFPSSNKQDEYNKRPFYIQNNNEYEKVTFGNFKIEEDYYYQNKNPYCADLSNDYLQPLGIYVKNAPVYGVQAKIGSTVVWTQPILVIQNKWPNAIVNAWDGKTLTLDHENNAILTAAIAAGSKNSNNEFSGVMIGDWSGTDTQGSVENQTGVYGFHNGAMSYALTEDGKAFFGKDGKGRIYINGDDATIYSSGYNNKNDKGMMIDLNDPFIVLKNSGSDKPTNTDTHPFQIGKNFNVSWDGDVYLGSGTIASGDGTIDLIGKIQVYDTSNLMVGTIGAMSKDNLLYGEKGVGFENKTYNGEDIAAWGQVKTTPNNTGLNFYDGNRDSYGGDPELGGNDGWISIEPSSTKKGIHIKMGIRNSSGGNNGNINNYFTLQNVPPENQFGIYARFA